MPGTTALLTDDEDRLALLDPKSGAVLWKASASSHPTDELFCAVPSPDGRTALTGTSSGVVRLWSLEEREVLWELRRRTSGDRARM